MNFLEAQQELAESIKSASSKVETYFWRLSGDAPNSLCKFLGMGEEELKVILRLCRIYTGEKDNFSKNNFEMTMSQSLCDWTTFRLNGKLERYIRIGVGGEITIPKDMYASDGSLSCYPVEDQHVRNIRTKAQKGSLPKLLDVGNKQRGSEEANEHKSSNKKQGVADKNITPKGLLSAYVADLVMGAGRTGDGKISLRSGRKLKRLIQACVDVAAKELLHSLMEKYAVYQHNVVEGKQEALMQSPEKYLSAPVETVAMVTPAASITARGVSAFVGVDEDPIIEAEAEAEDDVDDNDELSLVTTTDEFLSELKEEVILQSLLHKRIHEKKERVFQLEHRNGRRLLVVLPPDTLSVAAFDDEARRTSWVSTMLNTEERLEGMLLHLAKNHPDMYVQVGKRRRLSMKTVALNTAQTVALARVGALNDVRLRSVKSFLQKVGAVNLKLSAKELDKIDVNVGLHRTKAAVFGSYMHEWSRTKGKEKKAPEMVHYWNSSLSSEIEAEVDLYLQHRFVENNNINNSNSIPTIDYIAGGFAKPGVTVLFGGDHGDKHCPISCKINLSPPSVRKQKQQLGYQCPLIQFASVQCSMQEQVTNW